jgi:8-oxo-dGTP pyrophosphatase MutT (NUDIX family)
VTGAPEPGELDLDAAVREVREETGYEVRDTIRPVGFRYEIVPSPLDPAPWTELYGPGVTSVPEEVFLAEAGADDPRPDPCEHVEFRWCSGAEALALLH